MSIFSEFLLQILVFLNGLTGNLGLAIIAFTILTRTILLPITIPSLKAAKQMKAIQPELNKLKKQFKDDKKGLQAAQMDLYKKYNVNPLAGCLPQIVQLVVLILLYRVLIGFLEPQLGNNGEILDTIMVNGEMITTRFLGINLVESRSTLVLPVIAALSQLVLSVMIAPGAETPDIVPNKSKKKAVQEANKKEENFAEMAQSMQQQMIYIMPVFTGFFAYTFPAGLALYWIVTTVFSVVQQYFVSGWGGLTIYLQRALGFLQANK